MDGLQGITLPLAFVAGLASFLSPCVLPLVPPYLAYIGGWAGQGQPAFAGTGAMVSARVRGGVVQGGVAFVAGFSVVFIALFYALRPLLVPARGVLVPLAGAAVILMGLQVAGVLRMPFTMREYRLASAPPRRRGNAGAALLGASFAAGWTPCIGATLGAVLSSAVNVGTTWTGLELIVAYCIGLGVPFIAMAMVFDRATPVVQALNRRRRAIDIVSAIVLVLMGVLLVTNQLTVIVAEYTAHAPSWLGGTQ